MRKNKLPEFMLLLEQFFTEYMPLSSGLSPISANLSKKCTNFPKYKKFTIAALFSVK